MGSVVLIHGFTGSPASFDDLAARLSEGSAPRLHRPALVGHADAVPHPYHRFEQEVDRVAAEIRQSGASGAHLCGYSLGARVGLGLLARHACLFRSATLIGLHPGLNSAAERALRIGADERWCQLLIRQGIQAFSTAWEAQPIFATQRELPGALLARQRRIRTHHSALGLVRSLRILGLGQMPSYRGVFQSQPLRVRLLVGALDANFVRLGQELAGASSRVQLEVVEGAGHNLLLEAPDRVARVLTNDLAQG